MTARHLLLAASTTLAGTATVRHRSSGSFALATLRHRSSGTFSAATIKHREGGSFG